MPDEETGQTPSRLSDDRNLKSIPIAPLPQQPNKSDSGACDDEENIKNNSKQLAIEVHWLQHATFWSQVGLGVIGIAALIIYGCQVKVMQGQLDQRVLLTLNVRSACNRFT